MYPQVGAPIVWGGGEGEGGQDWGLARETNKMKKVILQGKIRRRGGARSRRNKSRPTRLWRSSRE